MTIPEPPSPDAPTNPDVPRPGPGPRPGSHSKRRRIWAGKTCSGPGDSGGVGTYGEHAELVAFRVGEHCPTAVGASQVVDHRGAEPEKALYLGVAGRRHMRTRLSD